jgi:hypothetical protein
VFSPNGQRVLSASADKTARLWELAGRAQVGILEGYNSGVWSAAFSPSGQKAVTASETAQIWSVFQTTQQLINESKRTVSRCLTSVERQMYFLDPEPPAWCIEMEKPPYATQDWKDWLRYKRSNENPPFPGTPEWQPWLGTHQ